MLRITALLALGLLLPVSPLHAQENIAPACLSEMHRALGLEQRLFRSVLFGQKTSQQLPPSSSVRFDRDGVAWLKTAANTWRTSATGYENVLWTDLQMDTMAEFPARRGLFEVKQASTSDLIPPVLQAVRSLQCRLKAACETAQASFQVSPPNPVTVEPPGCVPFTATPFPSCRLTPNTAISEVRIDNCDSARAAVMQHEMNVVELAIAYDASYRSLAQFAGIFEGFLHDFRFPLVEPLWQAVRAASELQGLPCFLSQCDE
jgi:hypothetical protein